MLPSQEADHRGCRVPPCKLRDTRVRELKVGSSIDTVTAIHTFFWFDYQVEMEIAPLYSLQTGHL